MAVRPERSRPRTSRIRIVLEEEAFELIQAIWRSRLSVRAAWCPLATAIGSSADRPAALAELVGIILNDGVRLAGGALRASCTSPPVRPTRQAAGRSRRRGERVLPPEIAAVVEGMIDCVEQRHGPPARGAYVDARRPPSPIGARPAPATTGASPSPAAAGLIESARS